MRLYTFTNFYLSSIQNGIQSAHVVHELFIKYKTGNGKLPDQGKELQSYDLWEWATNHKTMIVLNGGMASNLWEIVGSLDHENNKFAWAYFTEEEAALNSSITSVGIVLPERIYETAKTWPVDFSLFDKHEIEIMMVLNRCSLAH